MQLGQRVEHLNEHGTKLPLHDLNSCSCTSKTGKYLGTLLFSLTNMYCMFLCLDCILCEISILKCMQIHGVSRLSAMLALVTFPSAAAMTKQGLEQAADRP